MFPDHPSITATDSQSEPERIERLHRAYGYALCLADGAGDGAHAGQLIDKLSQLHDHKGTLIVFWSAEPSETERDFFRRAWASKIGDGSDHVEHEV